MKYIGDISRQDAKVLREYGMRARHILEFGMGGSTQILAQSGRFLDSVETDPAWIERTRNNLEALKVMPGKYDLWPYENWHQNLKGSEFELIFVDGIDSQRFPFALVAFGMLAVGGWILFHDTRRTGDLRNFLDLVVAFKDQVGEIVINVDHSNISGFKKKMPEPYVNWNEVENRSPWMTGAVEPPKNWPDLLGAKQ